MYYLVGIHTYLFWNWKHLWGMIMFHQNWNEEWNKFYWFIFSQFVLQKLYKEVIIIICAKIILFNFQVQITTLCISISLSGFVTLFCLFSPKVYIIVFQVSLIYIILFIKNPFQITIIAVHIFCKGNLKNKIMLIESFSLFEAILIR